MRRNMTWFLCLFLAGCITIESDPEFFSGKRGDSPEGLTNIHQLRLGMTYGEVKGVMGDEINIGYKKSDALEGAYEVISVKSPYREEILKGEYATYKVAYYFTHIRKPDGIVSDNELTPLVFKEDRLIGKGNGFLSALKDRLK